MRIAVTGATGRIGGQVVDLLAADGQHQLVAVTRRDTNPATAPQVRSATADYDDMAALRAALRDVETLVFVSSDGEAAKVLVHHGNVIQAAVESGVAHIVALSGLDADLASPFCYAVTYAYTEQLLAKSGSAVSIARASIYTEFFMTTWMIQARHTGQLRLPAADGRISLVSRSDVARSLGALAIAAPTGTHHNITGPEALDLAELSALAEQEWKTSIEYVELPPAEYRAEIARAGEDAWWEYAYSTMFDSIREQRWTAVTDDVLRLTGCPAITVRDVLAR
jgi:NAD(P)H dehydrogenase (quinone)